MNKKIGGLTLALVAIASMAASPARAERFEVTFTGTLTTAYTSFFCLSCSESYRSTESPIAPVSWSRTMVIDHGPRAGMDTTSVSAFQGSDVDGRVTWNDIGSQTIGVRHEAGALPANLAPASLLSWANVSAPVGPVTDDVNVRRDRMLTSYPDEPGRTIPRDMWSASRVQSWVLPDGWQAATTLEFFHWAPFPVTSDNIGDSLTSRQFTERMQGDFSCEGCQNSFALGVWKSNDTQSEAFYYWGSVSDFSMRELDASAVPEPSTYALMLAGVAAIGFAARRRKTA